jgi:hypothetical protein
MRAKTWYKRQKINLFGEPVILKNIKISMPPKEIQERYEKIERERKPIMVHDLQQEVKKSEIKKQRDVVNYQEIAEFVAQHPEDFKSSRSKPGMIILDAYLIAPQFRVSHVVGEQIKRLAESKIKEKEEGNIKKKDKIPDHLIFKNPKEKEGDADVV